MTSLRKELCRLDCVVMSVSAYIVFFGAASIIGWLFESLYSIVHTGRWERRGFLFGPFCPIYGIGVAAGLLLFNRPEIASGQIPAWAVFLASMAGSAVLEYSVSVSLEKLFGAVWWDYSDMPLNLNGRICLPASLLFGAGGLAVAYIIAPVFNSTCEQVPVLAFEIAALVIIAVLACDTTATVISLSDLMSKITQIDKAFNGYADDKVLQLHDAVQQTSQGVKNGVDKTVSQAKDGSSAVIGHMKNVKDATTRKTGAVISSQQARIKNIAGRLTARQVRLLNSIKRFRSDDLRDEANVLRRFLSMRPGTAEEERGRDGEQGAENE